MRLFFIAFTLITLVALPAMAQIEDQVAGTDRKGATILLNNRSYDVDKGALIESFSVSNETFLNVFDFENGLVYHKTPQTNEILETTSFKDIEKSRVTELKRYACYILGKSPSRSNSKQAVFFKKRHCGAAR